MIDFTLLIMAGTPGQISFYIGTIPAGIVVALIGAPYFIYLLIKNQ
ncbi:iron chelate uptake ABC transporter family permease subunit [Piscibacillus salipiscarius]|uniref:Iron chelate uptake ABC transporter family permease subunit n=1 Tax=Piscibacillus salipiscarius TaxID=299480 RepID=A0ABW5QDN7_9BACI|nr:iron chelate uptake ABC transporter family permease subunit [Piscibacillus salipiscarius]